MFKHDSYNNREYGCGNYCEYEFIGVVEYILLVQSDIGEQQDEADDDEYGLSQQYIEPVVLIPCLASLVHAFEVCLHNSGNSWCHLLAFCYDGCSLLYLFKNWVYLAY